MEDVKIVHLKSNAQKLETWIAMLNGEIVGHIYMEREDDNKIKFWNLNDYSCIKTIDAHDIMVLCLQLVNPNILASGSDDKKIKFWNL